MKSARQLLNLLVRVQRLGDLSTTQRLSRISISTSSNIQETISKQFRFLSMSSKTKNSQTLDNALASCNISEDTTNSNQIKNGTDNKTPSTTSTTTSAILRYESGADRFQLACVFKGKIFNFDRYANESLSTFFTRVAANISKKVKNFEGNEDSIKLLLGNDVLDSANETIASTFVKLAGKAKSSSSIGLSLQIDNEILLIEINPPEVFCIKFLKSAIIEFPIIPTKLEGKFFNKNLSKYVWEYTEKTDDEIHKQTHHRKKSLTKELWKACKNNNADKNSNLIFIPDKSLLNAKLRLTCYPSNDGIHFGNPLTEEMRVRVTAPASEKFLFHERLERLDNKPTIEENPNFARVVTYNALADTYATKEWFVASPVDCLPIERRLPVLCQELKYYQGDIVCLQEVDVKYYQTYYEPFLTECGYSGFFSCKTLLTKEGVALFYNNQKFKKLESTTLSIKDYMKTLPFYKNLEKHSNIIENMDNRNTVLQLAVLESLTCPETIVVLANTHLYFYPDADHIRCLQTLTSTHFIEQKFEEMKQKFPTKKVTALFCGDFNCTPPFSSFRFLTTGQIQESDYDWTSHETEKITPGINYSHNLGFLNTHPDHELTNIVKHFEGCLDYIFYQPNIQLIKTYPPPSKAKIGEICGITEEEVSLPNFYAPSDHVPLIADFNL